jgi:hypothetical protein
MPNLLGRFLLFLGSYSPLFGICCVVFWLESNTEYLAKYFLAITLLGVFGTILFLSLNKRINPEKIEFVEVKRKDTEILNYVVAYLIPFVAIAQGKEIDIKLIVAFSLFFFFLMILYIRSNILWVNPLLSCFGYYMYEVRASNGKDFTLISKNRNIKPSEIEVANVSNEILIEK